VSILAPFTTCGLTMLCGTGHVVYTMLPIIYDVAIKNGIRPERPMAASSIASQMGIIASPVSVAVVSLVAFLAKAPAGAPVIDFITCCRITIPSTLAGVLMIGIFSWFRGKDLDRDPDLPGPDRHPRKPQARLRRKRHAAGAEQLTRGQWTAMWIFVGAIAVVACWAPSRTAAAGGRQAAVDGADDPDVHAAGRCADRSCSPRPTRRHRQERGLPRRHDRRGGGVRRRLDGRHRVRGQPAGHQGRAVHAGEDHPWTFALALLLVSKLVNSQAAAISAMVPLGLAIGVPPGYVVAFAAACYGYYILPTYPSDLATIQFDRSGTTRIGKYVINHSFILPGLIGVATSCVAGWLIAAARGMV
jgi:anaerobic C4-dicarboxylate transporter DcuB